MENHIFIEDVGKGITKKRMFKRVTTYDAAIVRDAATYEREFGKNGFSKERSHRVIGEIPFPEFLRMQEQAREHGAELTGKDLKAYLRENPEYMTVNAFKTHGGHPNIIVK
ncbi:MAG: hypothetical protein RBR38_10355 [Desulfomicrobium apsheronum]|nr:hypothetical protein [Desulfomicrobium apsheronum]